MWSLDPSLETFCSIGIYVFVSKPDQRRRNNSISLKINYIGQTNKQADYNNIYIILKYDLVTFFFLA